MSPLSTNLALVVKPSTYSFPVRSISSYSLSFSPSSNLLSAFNLFKKETLKAFLDYSKGNDVIVPDGFIEFKRTMGTEALYKSSFMEKEYLSEELSAELLKKLKSYEIDEEIDAIVITIPMMFEQLQMDATL